MHAAALNGNVSDVERWLNEGADPASIDDHGRTCLHAAAEIDNVSIITLLINKGSPINAVTEDRLSALHFGARAGSVGACVALMNYGIDIDIEEFQNLTARVYAVGSKKFGVIDAINARVRHVKPKTNRGPHFSKEEPVGVFSFSKESILRKAYHSLPTSVADRTEVRYSDNMFAVTYPFWIVTSESSALTEVWNKCGIQWSDYESPFYGNGVANQSVLVVL